VFLKDILIVNYLSCQKLTLSFSKDDPNVFIGINDSGKSATLRAIGLLLSNKVNFNFWKEEKGTSDISNTRLNAGDYRLFLSKHEIRPLDYNEKQCIIIGKFEIEADEINNDVQDEISKHLLWTIEKSERNHFYMAIVFDETHNNSKTYLLCKDKKENPETLWNKKASELGQKKVEYGVSDDDIDNENRAGRYKNIELIRGIYSKIDLELHWSEYREFKKDISIFPEYRYLDWNMTLDDLNDFAKDVMKSVIEENMERSKKYADSQALEAEEQINENLIEIAEKLANDIPNINAIKAKLNFSVSSQLSNIMISKDNSDGFINLESQGDGVKRQIWFSLLKWKSMQTIREEDYAKRFIWCFDEPETHLFPFAQRQFFDIIKKISETNVQSILSSHSTIFIDRAGLPLINSFQLDNSYTIISKCNSVDDIYDSLQVKNSDFLFYNKFLIVEGETEYYLTPFLYKIHKGKSLLENNIQLINLKGKNNRIANYKILKSILLEFRKHSDCFIFLLDNDVKFENDAEELLSEDNIYFVGIQDLEDSIENETWLNCVQECISKQDAKIEVSIDEIKSLKDKLVEEKINENKKFYPQLRSLLRSKINEKTGHYYDILPDKGEQLANLLAANISNLNSINGDLIRAFEALD